MDRPAVREMESGTSAVGVKQGQPKEPGEGVNGNRNLMTKDSG